MLKSYVITLQKIQSDITLSRKIPQKKIQKMGTIQNTVQFSVHTQTTSKRARGTNVLGKNCWKVRDHGPYESTVRLASVIL